MSADRSPAPGPSRYRAFISYSTAADGRLAPAVQLGLQKFAKPWYRRRALTVFRDATGLALTPALWNSLESALAQSEFLVLLASPESAQSRWVQQEIDWWLRHRTPDRLLLVRTSGVIAWDPASGDFDWNRTTALPRSLSRLFAQEPLHLDLSWAHSAKDLSLRHPTFASAIARLSATLRGVALEDLIGEDLRLQRSALRLAAAAVTVLAVASAAGLYSTVVGDRAWRLSRQLAREGEASAESTRRSSRSAAWVAAARAHLDKDPGTSLLYALEAMREEATPTAESALRQALAGPVTPVQTLDGPPRHHHFARYAPDGRHLLAWGDGVSLRLLRADTGATERVLREAGDDILEATFSADGTQVLAALDAGSVHRWETATGAPLPPIPHEGVTAARVASAGARLLTLASGGDAILWNLENATPLATHPLAATTLFSEALAEFSPDGTTVGVVARTEPLVLDSRTGQTRFTLAGHSSGVWSLAFSPRGDWLATASEDGTARLWSSAIGRPERVLGPGPDGRVPFRDARFSPDNQFLAVRTAQPSLLIWKVATGEQVARVVLDAEDGAAFRFLWMPGGECLLTAVFGADTVDLWEAATGQRLGQITSDAGEVRTLSVQRDSRRIAVGRLFGPAQLYDCAFCGDRPILLEEAQRRVPRALTPGERSRVLTNATPPP